MLVMRGLLGLVWMVVLQWVWGVMSAVRVAAEMGNRCREKRVHLMEGGDVGEVVQSWWAEVGGEVLVHYVGVVGSVGGVGEFVVARRVVVRSLVGGDGSEWLYEEGKVLVLVDLVL